LINVNEVVHRVGVSFASLTLRARLKLITLPWELEVPTLSLASLAAVTPPQFEVAIVDLLREQLFLDERVDLVGISASTPRVKAAYALADLFRARVVKVVIGGHHATAMPEEALEHADAVVCGEAESSWRRLCEEFLLNPSRVEGIYRDPPPDLASLPQPRIDLMKIERYQSFYYPVIASRGCPEACSFCFAKRMTKGFRTYPIAHVIEQVRRRPSFIRSMYFVDDNLTADLDYARELFAELARYGVPFGMQARHELSHNLADLELARKAGCRLISSGYESVNQSSLDGTGKRASAEDYRQIISNIFDAGIMPSGNWMFGFDWDTPEVFEETLEFLDTTKLVHCAFTTEIPFPGTAAWRRYRSEGRLLTDDYDRYVGKDQALVRPKQMTVRQLEEGMRYLARGFYSPRRATARAIRGLRNKRLLDVGPWALRAPALLALNYFQVWQWHYRMVPSLQWLYQRIISVNKYRYFKDLIRRTNFHASEHLRADELAGVPERTFATSSLFLHAEGHKPSRARPLTARRAGPSGDSLASPLLEEPTLARAVGP
jgi:radical SAM superfamily enzyme YgiQ (UPF0313 family)